jgi:hypothetical protein
MPDLSASWWSRSFRRNGSCSHGGVMVIRVPIWVQLRTLERRNPFSPICIPDSPSSAKFVPRHPDQLRDALVTARESAQHICRTANQLCQTADLKLVARSDPFHAFRADRPRRLVRKMLDPQVRSDDLVVMRRAPWGMFDKVRAHPTWPRAIFRLIWFPFLSAGSR